MSECSFYISQQLIDIKNYRWCFLKPSQYYTEGYKHKRKLVTEASNVSFHSGNVSGNYSSGKFFWKGTSITTSAVMIKIHLVVVRQKYTSDFILSWLSCD